MIKDYNLFLLKEAITMSNEDIVEIIKSLETKNNKNAVLIKKLVNHKDRQGKTVLMNIIQSNNEELLDYVLKFKPEINQIIKNTGYNELFFCKNAKVFKRIWDLGVDILHKNVLGRTTLIELASKRVFNVDLYQSVIDSGVDISWTDGNNQSVLSFLVLNRKAVNFLIKNNVNLNGKDQGQVFWPLMYEVKYGRKLNYIKTAVSIIIDLFEAGLKLNNTTFLTQFFDNMKIDDIYDLLERIKNSITDKDIITIYNATTRFLNNDNVSVDPYVAHAKKLLNLGTYPEFYKYLKMQYSNGRFERFFADYIAEHPYFDGVYKYNL
jgi:hypothetical protein